MSFSPARQNRSRVNFLGSAGAQPKPAYGGYAVAPFDTTVNESKKVRKFDGLFYLYIVAYFMLKYEQLDVVKKLPEPTCAVTDSVVIEKRLLDSDFFVYKNPDVNVLFKITKSGWSDLTDAGLIAISTEVSVRQDKSRLAGYVIDKTKTGWMTPDELEEADELR